MRYFGFIGYGRHTVDVNKPGPVTNQSFGGLEQIPHADAQPNLVYDFICILDVDRIFDRPCASLVEVFWCNLNQIFNRCLYIYEFSAAGAAL